jgi:hypothetical protein
MAARYPKWDSNPSDYHTEYVWEFFAFNEVGRQELVGPNHVSPTEDFLHHLTD